MQLQQQGEEETMMEPKAENTASDMVVTSHSHSQSQSHSHSWGEARTPESEIVDNDPSLFQQATAAAFQAQSPAAAAAHQEMMATLMVPKKEAAEENNPPPDEGRKKRAASTNLEAETSKKGKSSLADNSAWDVDSSPERRPRNKPLAAS